MPGAGWAGCGLWRMGLRCRVARRGQRQGASEKERSESGEGPRRCHVACRLVSRVAWRMWSLSVFTIYACVRPREYVLGRARLKRATWHA